MLKALGVAMTWVNSKPSQKNIVWIGVHSIIVAEAPTRVQVVSEALDKGQVLA